ncbi:DUF6088 family protein [Rhizobium beringeri]
MTNLQPACCSREGYPCGARNVCSPQESEFGTYPPSAEKVVSSYGKITGERIVPSGARAANNLGLTTQVPVEELSSQRERQGL